MNPRTDRTAATATIWTWRRLLKLSLIAVVALLGLLGIGFLDIVASTTADRIQTANVCCTLVDLAALSNATKFYAIEHGGRFPKSLEEARSYLEVEPGTDPFVDAWRRPYVYTPPKRVEFEPHIVSRGSDGQPGGLGFAMDLDSADAERLLAEKKRQ